MVMDYPIYEEKRLVGKAQRLRLVTAVDTDRYHHGHHIVPTHRKAYIAKKVIKPTR